MDQESFDRGKRDAASDIAEEKCRLFWAARGSWGELFTTLMKDRFGVLVEHINCFTCEEKDSYEQGYNTNVIAYLNAKYGEGSFERVRQEVEDYRREQYRRHFSDAPVEQDPLNREIELTPEQCVELARRDAELDAKLDITLTWDQVRAGIEKKP